MPRLPLTLTLEPIVSTYIAPDPLSDDDGDTAPPQSGTTTPPASASGEGMKKKQSNKQSMTINKDLLKSGKMQVRNKNGHLLINRKCDKDTCDLIMKPFHHSKKYSAQSIKNYQDLMKLQGTPNDPKLLKLLAKTPPTKALTTTAPAIFTNTNEMLDKLELIIGSKNAGNNSTIMINEGRSIIDALLKGNVINKTEHEQMFKKYFNI